MPENTPFSNRLLSSAGINPYEQQQNNKVEKPPYLQTDFNKKLSQNVEPPKSMEDFVADRGMQWLQRSIDRNDMNAQMTPYTYNAGSDSHSFYNRYAAFGQEKMDRIGFSPFKNNDEAFNAQTSFLDRAQRSIVHGFVPLFARGFVSGPKSLARMMQGDFGDDPEDARKYAEAAAIAQDTSGGIGAFFNNTLMNFGYTAGIIGEAVAEELALTALSGGVGGFANLPRFGANIGRAFRGIKGAETLVDMTASLNKSLKSLVNIDKAREFFNAGKIGAALETRLGKATTRLANFANPAENLLETGIEIAKNTKQLQGWNRFNNATFKTAGALYRDVRNINMAVAEARLEAGFTRNDTFSKLMADYQEKHNGALPSESLRKAMMSEAEQASKDTLLANSLLIFASNKVTFNNVMNPKSGLARMMAKKVAEVKKMATQTTVREFTKQTLKSGKELLTPKLTTIKGAWATAKKQGVQKTVKAAIGYTKANLMEGVQEVLQEVISETSKNYHLQSFYSQPVGYYMYTEAERKMMTDKSFGDILGEAFGKQASMQGLETFASGFVMGAFASPLNRAIPFAQESYMRVFKKDEYQAHRDKIDKYVARMTKSVNDTFAKDPLEFLNSRVFSLGTQAELANVIDTGDVKGERDAKEEATIKSVTDLIKMDSLEIWTDYMESLKELTTEEYAEAVGISVEQAQGHVEKLDKVIGRAKEIEKTYKEYINKYPSPIDLNDYKKGTREYEKAAIYHNAWEEARKNVIFYHENYKNTVERMQKIYQSIGNEELLGKIDPNRVQALLKDDRILGEIQVLESEVQGLKGMTDPVSKRKLKQTEATLDVLKEYQKDYENFMDHFFEKGMVEPGTEAEKAERLALDKQVEDKLGDSFKNYMKALAKQSDDMILNDNIDIAFNDVLDHYKLGREAGKLADAVNVLNDPAGFIDHVAKTYDWMYEMWNNREDYIQENISKQLDIIKSNQLLNDMADIGVYVDLDEFADYQETGVIPTEFFDAINKRVIKRGSPIYDKVANRFMELSEFKKVIKESKPVTKNKNDELAKLDAEEAEEISNLPKVPTRIDIKTLDEKDFSAKLINDELTEGQFIDVNYKEKDVEKTATFFKDQDGILREDNAQGEPVDLESDIKYNNGEIYEIVNRPTDADIAEVRKRYDALRAELLERLNKYGPSASTEAMAKSVEEVKAMLLSDDEYTSTRRNYIIKGKVYERMTNRIKQNHSSFKYTHRSKLENAYDETIGDGPLTEESINAFISKLKSEQPDGFEDYTYTELEEELKSLMEEPLTETTPVADIKVKIADIEKRKKEDLAKLESIKDQIGDAFNFKESSNALLKSIYKFMSSNFNWKFEERNGNLIKFSKESGNTEFNIDGLDVDVKGTATVMGGSQYNAEIDPYDIIEAKYNAELGTLKQPVNKDLSAKKAEIAELERQKSELLKAQPTKTTSEKTYQDIFNEKWPDASGYLTAALTESNKEESKFVAGKHIFEIRPIGNNKFEYRVVNNRTSQNRAFNNYDKFIKLTSQELNVPDGADTIVTVKPGILRKEGDGFIFEKEAQVFYANSSTINNKVGTTTAAPTRVDTTEIDSRIAKAKEELDALEQPSAAEVKIIQTNKPNIQTVGNVTFGTANKQGTTEDNEDAVYVDTQNGIFILADGMGGEYSAFGLSKNFSKDTINFLLTGNFSTSLKKIVDYINSKKGTVKDTSELIEEIENILGYKLSSQSRVKINQLILSVWKKETVSSKGNRLGATALKAKKVGDNTYKIEKVGDTVFFVVDKNGKVIQKHGLSDNASTQGYITYLKDGEAFANSPKIDEFTITLNEGETLVLSTDFIETDKAVQDFIDSDFGKKLNFTEFQKNNKEDDSTFISIKYDAELGTLEQPVNKDLSAKKAEIERRRQEDLIETPRAYIDPTMGYSIEYLIEQGALEGPVVQKGKSNYLRIKEGVDNLNKKINAKYDAELAALEQPVADKQAQIDEINERKKKSFSRTSTGMPPIGFNYSTDSGYTGTYYAPDGTTVPVDALTEKEVREKINARYKEELDALEGATPTPAQKNIAKAKAEMKKLKVGDTVEVVLSGQRTSTGQNKITDFEDYGDGTYRISFETTGVGNMLKDVMVDEEGVIDVRNDEIFAYINFNKPTETKTLRSVQKELDALNDKVDKLNEQIEEADDAGNQTRAENLRMRRQELYDLLKETAERGKEAVPEIKSNLKNYVINYAIENAYETSKANGIYLDNQFKAVFDPKSAGPVFDSKYITQEAYDDLFGENGYITSIKKRADAGEFYVFSTDLIVYTDTAKDSEGNLLPPVAGEIDFIFVDREGRKFIVDLKTGQTRKWMEYNKFNSWAYDKKIDNTLQQVGYANLSQRASGEEFQIAIWPVELNYEKTGYINRAGRPSDPTLMLNQKPIGDLNSEPFIINLDKNVQFEIISPEGGRTGNFMTVMDFMEQYVTGPVTPGKKGKAKPKGQAIPQDESSIVDAITNEIQNGNVIKAGMDANMAKTQGTISDASYKYLIGLINQRMNTVLQESAVLAAPGQQFITINDIFAERFDGIISVESKVEAGEIATVESVDEANEEIILVTSNGDRFTVKFSEMNDYIVSPEQLDDKTAPTQPKYEPTQTEIDFTTESMVNVDEFLENSNLRNQATNEADNQSSDEIDNDLFSNLICPQ